MKSILLNSILLVAIFVSVECFGNKQTEGQRLRSLQATLALDSGQTENYSNDELLSNCNAADFWSPVRDVQEKLDARVYMADSFWQRQIEDIVKFAAQHRDGFVACLKATQKRNDTNPPKFRAGAHIRLIQDLMLESNKQEQAEIERQKTQEFIRDLKSANETFVAP